MQRRLFRSINEPIREGLSWYELWKGPDSGLIWCWERGRQYQTETTAEWVWRRGKHVRLESPAERAARAANGELVLDGWRGGVKEKLKVPVKAGTLSYLATWLGMRNEDLDIDLDEARIVVCSRTGQAVAFSAASSSEEGPEEVPDGE